MWEEESIQAEQVASPRVGQGMGMENMEHGVWERKEDEAGDRQC